MQMVAAEGALLLDERTCPRDREIVSRQVVRYPPSFELLGRQVLGVVCWLAWVDRVGHNVWHSLQNVRGRTAERCPDFDPGQRRPKREMGIDKADKMLPVVFPSRDPRMYEVLQDEIPLSDFECAVRWFECIWHGRTLERARRDVNGFREQQQQPMLHAVGAAGGRADPRRPRERRAGT